MTIVNGKAAVSLYADGVHVIPNSNDVDPRRAYINSMAFDMVTDLHSSTTKYSIFVDSADIDGEEVVENFNAVVYVTEEGTTVSLYADKMDFNLGDEGLVLSDTKTLKGQARMVENLFSMELYLDGVLKDKVHAIITGQ